MLPGCSLCCDDTRYHGEESSDEWIYCMCKEHGPKEVLQPAKQQVGSFFLFMTLLSQRVILMLPLCLFHSHAPSFKPEPGDQALRIKMLQWGIFFCLPLVLFKYLIKYHTFQNNLTQNRDFVPKVALQYWAPTGSSVKNLCSCGSCQSWNSTPQTDLSIYLLQPGPHPCPSVPLPSSC